MPSGKVRVLLETLLLAPNVVRTAAELVELLWPDESLSDEVATRRLHTTVSRLRSFLGGVDTPTQDTLTVLTEGTSYCLHATAETLDRLAFEAAASAALDEGDADAATAALELWRGEPYTGFVAGASVQAQRTRLAALRRRLLDVQSGAAGSSLQEQLLSAKRRPPRVDGAGVVLRSRLLASTPRVGEVAVLAAVAPAGYGKSTFLAQWTKQQDALVAWVSLDESDDDPARLWTEIERAISDVSPHLRDSLGADHPPGSPSFIDALLTQLDRFAAPLALVLDDIHVVHNRDVLGQIEGFASALPPGCTLVLSSRTELPVPVGRMQADGCLSLLSVSELRFDHAEIESMVERDPTPGKTPSADTLGELTGGWPVAVTLLRHNSASEGLSGPFSAHRSTALGRYIVEVVLAALPDEVATFVLETVHLERFNQTLCDAVTERGDAARMLGWLRRHQTFLVEVEPGRAGARSWYRYHDLVAEVLQSHVRDATTIDVEELHRRAARWCIAHGLEAEALGHALGGGELEVAASAAGNVLMASALAGEALTCTSWLRRIDPDDLVKNPRSHAIGVYLSSLWLDAQSRRVWTKSRVDHFGDEDDVVWVFTRAVDSVRQGRASEAVELSGRVIGEAAAFAVDLSPELAPILASGGLSNLVLARLLQGTLRHDDDLFPNAVALVRPSMPLAAAWLHSYWALAAIVDGEEALARSLVAEYQQGRTSTQLPKDLSFESSAIGALLVSNQTRSPAGHRRLAEGIETELTLHERFGGYTLAAVARLIAACVYRRAGAHTIADEYQGRAEVLLRTFPDAPFLSRFRDHLHELTHGPTGAVRPVARPAESLTTRERVVLRYLASELSVADIAQELFVSPSTVRTHVASIYRKLGVHRRHEAVIKADTLGL